MPYGKTPAKMGHKDSAMEMSPYKMGHKSAMKMESAKQEKYNLMHDNPVAKHASGGSWMSKHSQSALHMGHESPAKMGHEGSPAKHEGDYSKGTHWHANDGSVITEKEGKKHKRKLPTGPNVPAKMKYDSPAGKHCM